MNFRNNVFRLVQSLFKSSEAPTIQVSAASTASNPLTGITIESLWNDFERRTYDYSYLKDRVGGDDQRLLNWVGSIDHSGYIREKCLRHLIENMVAGDENRILLRLVDWVSPVRAIACDWLARHFHELPLESIKTNQRLILYLSRKEKVQSLGYMKMIEDDLLLRMGCMDCGTFHQFDTPFRRFILRLSLQRDQCLRDWILLDKEPFNRLLLLEARTGNDLTPSDVGILAQDRSVHVRRRFAMWMVERGEKPTREFLMSLAFDSNRGIRQFARFYLMRLHETDVYPIYRSCSNSDFYLTADYARTEDANVFVEGCRHPSKRVRVDCLRALTVAAPDRLLELDLGELIRSNRETRRIVCFSAARIVDIDQLMALKSDIEESSVNGSFVFLRMLESKSFWRFLDAGLAYLERDVPLHVGQYIRKRIHAKVSINEKLPEHLRESICATLARLRDSGSAGDACFFDQIDFMLKHA